MFWCRAAGNVGDPSLRTTKLSLSMSSLNMWPLVFGVSWLWSQSGWCAFTSPISKMGVEILLIVDSKSFKNFGKSIDGEA